MSSEATLSIGALSRATGIPVETLRTWERRYGFPSPSRRPSGHRVYPLSTVPRLRRVVQALQQGHRPADMLGLDEHQLEELIDRTRLGPPRAPARETGERTAQPRTRDLVAATRSLQESSLRAALQLAGLRQGTIPFLTDTIAPFLKAIGDLWAKGRLGVRHEHFASAVVADVLRDMRRGLEQRGRGPLVAMASLPGDDHEIGLIMASVVFVERGWRVLYLGLETPVEQIVALADETWIDAVAIGLSETAPAGSRQRLAALRQGLPATTELVVGGAGAPRRFPGARCFSDLRSLHDDLLEREAEARTTPGRRGRPRGR